jgi:hypothetical protein
MLLWASESWNCALPNKRRWEFGRKHNDGRQPIILTTMLFNWLIYDGWWQLEDIFRFLIIIFYFKYRVLQNPKLNLRYLSYFLQNKNIKWWAVWDNCHFFIWYFANECNFLSNGRQIPILYDT